MPLPRSQTAIPGLALNAAGLVALADLRTIAERTALTGTSTALDALVLCPGIHCQQKAPELHRGELPPTAAMTTGYVFRVENPATVRYLQKVGVAGHLVTLHVEKAVSRPPLAALWHTLARPDAGILSELLYAAAALLTVLALVLLALLRDWAAASAVLVLMSARALNVAALRRRALKGWKGVPEPGVRGDLLVLLSQDRWVRLQGLVDSLKTVTAGQWLRDASFFEASLHAAATLLVYLDAALASNATQLGSIVLVALLLGSVGLLALSNATRKVLQMHGNLVSVQGEPKAYARRLDLVEQLVAESGRDDWAIRLGMMHPKSPHDGAELPVAVQVVL